MHRSQLILNQNFNAKAIICKNNKVLDKYLNTRKLKSKLYKVSSNVNDNYLKQIKNEYFRWLSLINSSSGLS